MYVSSAPFVAVYRASDVSRHSVTKPLYMPVFQCIERTLKGMLCVNIIYLRRSAISCSMITLVLESVLLAMFYCLRPCNMFGILTIRHCTLLSCVCITACSLVVEVIATAYDFQSIKTVWVASVS